MIPLWLKLLWGAWLLATWITTIFSFSGLLIESFEKQKGNINRTIESEVYKAVSYTLIMWVIVVISFVIIMLIYNIPISKWVR